MGQIENFTKMHLDAISARRNASGESDLKKALKENENHFLNAEWNKVDESVKKFIIYQTENKKGGKNKGVE